ncbi:Adenylyltransferase and sulfurtransferase uba4 [Tolypocladium ophioglossoides CBS 100239]|uniref:Adenylyltransferase and sulfurtransferase uba4 n=1 Tax=Tolypocladium ophioglossoides (strain CBS 100239) TaxID=1163406 RepID=A0A0L0N813_TOLOC|nr:Adenylyltransferase and sulfurtransferase uba4 [Tolypocladium ophioglossoides CBS 100239]
MDKIDHLRREIAKRESELADLKSQLAVAESEHRTQDESKAWRWPLQDHEYQRYGRQMVVPSFGLQAQLRLKNSRVLVVGAGGLGCPAAAYLAGAGVGVLGLVDADEVEVSNLHRQVAHSTGRVGMSKVLSAITYLRELNPTITYKSHREHLSPHNAQAIVSQYDLVLDCTDHPTSRYLVSDACILLRRPLVSASAFQTSGQLIVLNSPPGKGPCYRCVFPRPPPPESVVGCGEGGVLGPVVGVMGVLQALEAIKLIARGGLEAAEGEEGAGEQRVLIFSAMGDGPSFRSVRMRGRRKDCFACSAEADLTLEHLETSVDYVQFCGVAKPVAVLRPEERITVKQYCEIRAAHSEHTLLDVREKEHFSLGSIPGAINVPISRFNRGDEMPELTAAAGKDGPIYVVCRVGNDSQVAARKLKDLGFDNGGERFVGDISGGIQAWRGAVDPTLPFL